MNRRECLTALALTASAGAIPLISLACTGGAGGETLAVYDGRFAEARAFARPMDHAYDCRHDAAGLWFGQLAHRRHPGVRIIGLTTGADAMVLADCARRAGQAFRSGAASGDGRLIAWTIAGRCIV